MPILTERSQRIRAAAQLHKTRIRAHQQCFLIEGANLVRTAISCQQIRDIFVTDAAADRYEDLLAHTSAHCHYISDGAAKLLSQTTTSPGIFGICPMPSYHLEDLLCRPTHLLVCAININEPGNAGTLIRLADAMGAEAIIFSTCSVDPYNSKCLRSSTGSIFTLPVIVNADANQLLTTLHTHQICTIATSLQATTYLDELGECLTHPTAWFFGSEAHGLDPTLTNQTTYQVRIRMGSSIDSLNVSQAAAICLYESFQAHHQHDRSTRSVGQ